MSSNPALTRVLCTLLLLLSACGLSELEGLTGADGGKKDGGKPSDASASESNPTDDGGDEGLADTVDVTNVNPCGCKHGTCSDAGCACDLGFKGSLCDTCVAGYYGPTCSKCSCTHGTCSEGLTGSGTCTCELGWTGASCVATGLVLYWKFDETSGVTAADSSGSNLPGNYVSTSSSAFPTPTLGAPLPAMTWDTSNLSFQKSLRHAVQIPTMPSAPPNFSLLKPANNMTIALWYKTSLIDLGVSGSDLVSMGDHYVVRLERDRIDFNKHITSGTNSVIVTCSYVPAADAGAPAFLNGNWHHVAAISSSSGVALYLDGQKVPCSFINEIYKTYNLVYSFLGSDFWVGRHGFNSTNYDFNGNLDELRIYSRVLSDAEIQALAGGTHLPP